MSCDQTDGKTEDEGAWSCLCGNHSARTKLELRSHRGVANKQTRGARSSPSVLLFRKGVPLFQAVCYSRIA
jgi:hypothetical protein